MKKHSPFIFLSNNNSYITHSNFWLVDNFTGGFNKNFHNLNCTTKNEIFSEKLLTNNILQSIIHCKFEYHKMTVTRTVGL